MTTSKDSSYDRMAQELSEELLATLHGLTMALLFCGGPERTLTGQPKEDCRAARDLLIRVLRAIRPDALRALSNPGLSETKSQIRRYLDEIDNYTNTVDAIKAFRKP